MALQGAPPGAEAFLKRACQTALQFDDEGQAVLPVSYWRRILDELGLQDDSEGAFFLMDFVEPHGEGFFTFEPLLEVVGMQPRAAEADAEAETVQPARASAEPLEGEREESFRQEESFSSYSGPNGYGKGRGKGDAFPESAGGYPAQFEAPRARPSDLFGDGPPAEDMQPRNYAEKDDHSEQSSVAPQLEVVDDVFWQRRGPQIQALYYQWDCNRLTNDAFQAQMQSLLGESVDVTHHDSEFFRLICKHRSARTMKFASLMSGLRRDAHNTLARRTGGSLVFGGSSIAGSSHYEPSEVGSEAMSSAGRPSGGNFQPGTFRGGRRHFVEPQDNPVLPARYQPPRLGQLPENEITKDFSPTGNSVARRQGPSPADFWSHGASRDHDRSDAMSVTSAADSQRSNFQERNRGGHGNILTWGNPRNVTPPKSRQGRQQVPRGAK
mmetsp:Transcript_7782/g.13813  ORF Transcript_7782/g.13813 Transcript_7782/m.13813 type:complete len:439 (-) Transcript_7782:111-1427(-)